jgi:hypothetical protein
MAPLATVLACMAIPKEPPPGVSPPVQVADSGRSEDHVPAIPLVGVAVVERERVRVRPPRESLVRDEATASSASWGSDQRSREAKKP